MACGLYCYFCGCLNYFCLRHNRWQRERRFFPYATVYRRWDDRRVISGIIDVIRDGLRWKEAAKADGPDKTLDNRVVRWRRLGVFQRIFDVVANQGAKPSRLMIDATHLKAHRTAASLRQKGPSAVADGQQIEFQASCCLRWQWTSDTHRPDRRAAQ